MSTCSNCSARAPIYAQRPVGGRAPQTEAPRTLEFESDGRPETKDFGSWGLKIQSVYSNHQFARYWIQDGVLSYQVPAGFKLFVVVSPLS